MLHQYKLNGYNIVLDTCSGAVHVVDDVAYDMIAMYKEKPLDAVIVALLEKYGELPLLFAGGVMSNQIIKNSFEEKYNAIFAPPQFSADNSAGIAYLGYRKYNDVHTRV